MFMLMYVCCLFFSRRSREDELQAEFDRKHIHDEENFAGHAMYGGSSFYSNGSMSGYKANSLYGTIGAGNSTMTSIHKPDIY